ncbi:DUF1385 domain-containing protein [Ilyobacter polytropus]|uniref:Metal-dependent enzyme n=1 Tax=Ilyobacter polytropus (strain ATCC 51220 / DSM 2926 / LMG 16218 / CuHBu1) TaxID=572544 RepID=E3HB74_ILYPC|nr:DUF1385 domain-containing protein [Ilyobacter polytropus]ADO82225.1 protein of unknown function DUF1385 [Ilyobacter polytropus DSM 2926]
MKNKEITVGGQAVIEGVMMKGSKNLATAVRKPDGEIVYRKTDISSKSGKISKLPFVRGSIILFSTLILGTKELTFSANQADDTEEELSDKELFMTVTFALLLGVGLFMVLPSAIGGLLFSANKLYANILEAFLRLLFFVVYIWAISFSKDIRRVFEYHGAEHKSIYAFENGLELTPENAKQYTTLHPRCGTSFLLIVMLCSIFVFSIVDFVIPTPATMWGRIGLKAVLRVLFMPAIAGLSYEFQRFTSRNLHKKWVRTLASPGLLLQKITTKEPDLDQLEVAIVALRVAMGETVDNAVEIENKNLKVKEEHA